VVAPPFSVSFFLPKYWLTWLGVLLLYIISWLPYRFQVFLGKKLGWLLGKLAKKRVAIARRNLELCFPEMDIAAREKLVKENVENAGLALLEAGMGWWWPDWRIRNIGKVEGLELVEAILARGNGLLLRYTI
jgi:KDO2-lipid IV(A) lauroyltransferase